MGLIGRSFVIASLTAGMLITALVMRTEGETRYPEPTLHVALNKAVPMLLKGDGGTTIAPSRLASVDPWRGAR